MAPQIAVASLGRPGIIRKENNCSLTKVKKSRKQEIKSKDTQIYDAPQNYNIFRAIKQTFIEKMYHTIRTYLRCI